VGGEQIQERGVGVEGGLVSVRDLLGRLVLEARRDQHPVLAPVEALVAQMPDVGDVLDLEDVDPVIEHRPADEIGEEEGPEVADVGVAVDGRPAGVHPEPLPVGRLDGLDRPGERVAKAERHPRIVPAAEDCGEIRWGCPNDFVDVSLSGQRPRGNDIVPPAVW
jgi:hypothetical protein